jgi:hypothetical protein
MIMEIRMSELPLHKAVRVLGMGAFALCALLFLSSCSSMSNEECRVADWRLLGYEDAMAGRSTANIASYRRACAGVAVVPDLDLYRQGHQEGARQYCTVANGYRAGSNGSSYQGICPVDLELTFMQGFQDGRSLYTYTNQISTLQSELRQSESELAQYRRQIETLESAIVAADSSPDQRRADLSEIETLNGRIAEREVLIAQTQRRIAELELGHRELVQEHRQLGY